MSDILSDICFEILCGILSDILSRILSGTYFDILSRILLSSLCSGYAEIAFKSRDLTWQVGIRKHDENQGIPEAI